MTANVTSLNFILLYREYNGNILIKMINTFNIFNIITPLFKLCLKIILTSLTRTKAHSVNIIERVTYASYSISFIVSVHRNFVDL